MGRQTGTQGDDRDGASARSLRPLALPAELFRALRELQAPPPPSTDDEDRIAWENTWF